MTKSALQAWLAAIVMTCAIGGLPCRGEPQPVFEQSIAFDDIAPAGITLKQCWDALGMDSEERIYIGFTSVRSDGREDFAVFRYDPSTGERRFLGTFMDASRAAGNLQPAEQIPKGHTHLLEIDGKMYMASQGFHDLKAEIDTLPTYRGSHLYAYDISRGVLEDVSRALPGGVVTDHQGLIAFAHAPGSDLLVGLAHPSSDIVLFDTKEARVQRVIPGIPWRLGNPLSREVVATKKGKIYSYRGTEDPAQRDEVHGIWAYDLETNRSIETAFTATGGFWNGQTSTRDGGTIYLATVNGELYKLDVDTEAFTHLGHFLPENEYAAGERVSSLYGITLSADEKRIYGIPRRSRAGGSNLYSYEIATGAVTLVGQLDPAVYTGSHMRDSHGNIYFARFGDGHSWEGNARLAILHEPALPR
ncbi:MAG: PQQ-like beta-propeller repeat protein [Alphaproteobacteria bacterium]|nr:PQQ-like beta-propeller repeat protein [Alphaproteobacteria bacterium]